VSELVGTAKEFAANTKTILKTATANQVTFARNYAKLHLIARKEAIYV
jgi:hypothetical protein